MYRLTWYRFRQPTAGADADLYEKQERGRLRRSTGKPMEDEGLRDAAMI
jgi:hypothetical protein